jgi:hypothetical protein
MKNMRFTKGYGNHKGSTYTCSICGKLTRDTGEGEASVEQCAYCFLEGGLENSLSDGYITQEQFDQEIVNLKKKYKR